MAKWLEMHGWRLLTSDDVDAPTLNEQPQLQARILTNLSAEGLPEDSVDSATIRALVPANERDRFDMLLADARYGLRLRDDNVGLRLNWPAGLTCRALLEAGSRLVGRGPLTAPGHVFCLEPREVAELLRDQTVPTAETIVGRSADRERQLSLRAPDNIGPDEAPPPLHLFPRPMRRATAAILTLMDAMQGVDTQKPLTGMGGGGAPYTGRACVIASPEDDLNRIQPGDVLIAPFTSPSFNSVLPLLGAIVAQEGGVLSHTAIVAREFGIPAIVGVRGLLDVIQDGQIVEVDPSSGTVRPVMH